MASRIGLRLMPNFRASSASFMRPPGLRRPDVISFNRKLRTCSDRLSVSKNEMAPSHAEIFGRLCADCGQKATQVKRAAIETRRRPRSPISAKCSAPVGARRSFLSRDSMIFPHLLQAHRSKRHAIRTTRAASVVSGGAAVGGATSPEWREEFSVLGCVDEFDQAKACGEGDD